HHGEVRAHVALCRDERLAGVPAMNLLEQREPPRVAVLAHDITARSICSRSRPVMPSNAVFVSSTDDVSAWGSRNPKCPNQPPHRPAPHPRGGLAAWGSPSPEAPYPSRPPSPSRSDVSGAMRSLSIASIRTAGTFGSARVRTASRNRRNGSAEPTIPAPPEGY